MVCYIFFSKMVNGLYKLMVVTYIVVTAALEQTDRSKAAIHSLPPVALATTSRQGR